MDLFARSYARRSSSPLPSTSEPRIIVDQAKLPPTTESHRRVRVVRGALTGMTGQVVCQSDPGRWLVEADQESGLFLRVGPQMLEPLPAS
jgi:hypothetical protein